LQDFLAFKPGASSPEFHVRHSGGKQVVHMPLAELKQNANFALRQE